MSFTVLFQSHSTTTNPKYTVRQYLLFSKMFDKFRLYTRATIGNWRKSTPENKVFCIKYYRLQRGI